LPNLVLVVEGHGDVDAFPNIVGKVGAWLGSPLFCVNPIRCGGWGRLKKEGGLEKWVQLAASRPGCSRIVIVVDLDDGCPAEERSKVAARVGQLKHRFGMEIEICFCVREFEAWLLAVLDRISADNPEYDWITQDFVPNAETFRDAKGALRDKMNESYGEGTDQGILSRAIPAAILYARSRSFRRFVRAVSGLDYETLSVA